MELLELLKEIERDTCEVCQCERPLGTTECFNCEKLAETLLNNGENNDRKIKAAL